MKGCVFNIQKFSINDGPGIRTTVFLKGCPLSCIWCHNPESHLASPQILYDERKCIGCRACAEACSSGAHLFSNDGHSLDRSACVRCNHCADACVTHALEISGKQMTAREVMDAVLRDKIFYRDGGGMTISGGEPLMQPDFCTELLRLAKENGIHTAIETSGYAPREVLERICSLVDLFLYDWKITDPTLHEKYTGVSNQRIYKNLRYIDALGANIILRCPIIPGINDTDRHFSGIAELANGLSHVTRIDVEPYHPLGKSKAKLLGKDYPLKDLSFPENETVSEWISAIEKKTSVPVSKG